MKNYLKNLAMVAVVGIAGVGIVGADQWDKKTVITTDEVLQLPNTTLQPGTYVIKLFSSPAERHIVQFFDKDEKHVIATINAIPNERLKPTGKTVFAFWEVPAGQPKALRAWFYPGDDFGQEFKYSKEQAATITASNRGATVPVEEAKTTEMASSAPADNDSSATTPVVEPAPTPAPAPVEVAAAAEQPSSPAPMAAREEPATPAPSVAASSTVADTSSDAQRVNQPSAETLPKTASPFPLVGLIGLLSIVAALGLNLVYNRS